MSLEKHYNNNNCKVELIKGDHKGKSKVPYYFLKIYIPDELDDDIWRYYYYYIHFDFTVDITGLNMLARVDGRSKPNVLTGVIREVHSYVLPEDELFNVSHSDWDKNYCGLSFAGSHAGDGEGLIQGIYAFAGIILVYPSGKQYRTNTAYLYQASVTSVHDTGDNDEYLTDHGVGPTTLGSWPYDKTLGIHYSSFQFIELTPNDKYFDFYYGEVVDINDPNPGDGDSHGGGGGGTDDLGGDPIKDTGVPTIEATDSGLMTLYNPTVSELQALGRFLWSDGLDLNSFKKLFNDPFDTLLGLSIIPIVPPTSGTKKIMFGNLDSGVSAKVISHQFVPNVDMGSVTLGEVYNGALDYSPFTTVSIYLPFIGYRELNVQDIMNSKIHLVYKFDVLTGGCIAELYVDHLKTGNKSKDNSKFKWESHSGLLASFEGQCAVNIPLASQDYTNTIRAMIGAVGMVGGAAASFATGNPALGVAALAVGSANSSIQASTPTVQRSGHLSSSNAIMANLTPFLTVTRPHQCKPSKYYKLRGVPSQIYVSKLSSLTTSKHDYYLQVAEIPDIKVAGATDTEIAEIKNLLKEGVVL